MSDGGQGLLAQFDGEREGAVGGKRGEYGGEGGEAGEDGAELLFQVDEGDGGRGCRRLLGCWLGWWWGALRRGLEGGQGFGGGHDGEGGGGEYEAFEREEGGGVDYQGGAGDGALLAFVSVVWCGDGGSECAGFVCKG